MLKEIKNKLSMYNASNNNLNIKSAVVILLTMVDGELSIIFQKRSSKLRTQPSEVSLPGGKLNVDETPLNGAIREVMEELNIKKDHISIISDLDMISTHFNLVIYPFVGELLDIQFEDIVFNKEEVDELFAVPVQYFIDTDPVAYKLETSYKVPSDFPFDKIPNGKDYSWRKGSYLVFFYEYGDYIIWGLTARIIRSFVNIIQGSPTFL